MAPYYHHSMVAILSVILTFILVALIEGSEGVKCYVCNSGADKDCGGGKTPVPAKYLITCSQQVAYPPFKDVHFTPPKDSRYTFCRKNTLNIDEQDNNDTVIPAETRIIRSCGYLSPPEKSSCEWISGVEQVCQCLTDGCNAADSPLTRCPWTTLLLGILMSTTLTVFIGSSTFC